MDRLHLMHRPVKSLLQILGWWAAPRPQTGRRLDACELAILAAFTPSLDLEAGLRDSIERQIDLETSRAEDQRRNRLIFLASALGGMLGALMAAILVAALD